MQSIGSRVVLFCALLGVAANAAAAGRLVVEHAWIRSAPPSALMRAGYAVLRNDGDAPVTVTGADSADFADVQVHQTVLEDGVERMRPTGRIDIAPGRSVEFAPGGKHFMLIRPKRELPAGAKVKIHISTSGGNDASVEFVVSDTAP